MRILVGTYLSLLSAFADSGNVEQCKKWLAEMEAAGHSVDQVAYAAVINAYRCAYPHNALQLFEHLIVISALFLEQSLQFLSHIQPPYNHGHMQGDPCHADVGEPSLSWPICHLSALQVTCEQ